jgi:hypothetical protein
MGMGDFIRKGISLQRQRANLPPDGPLTPYLEAMSALGEDDTPISLPGSDLASEIRQRSVWVLFVHTAGSGATPWRGFIVLDSEYRSFEERNKPNNVALVGHELAHLLQRELRDPDFWPSGGLRPSTSRRWVGDSTNYMEALAYIVGSIIEFDLVSRETGRDDLPPAEEDRLQRQQRSIENRLATLTGEDAENATRFVLKSFPNTAVYRKNYRVEARHPQGRIPAGGWSHWLGVLGFSEASLTRIRNVASSGTAEFVDPAETDEIAGL